MKVYITEYQNPSLGMSTNFIINLFFIVVATAAVILYKDMGFTKIVLAFFSHLTCWWHQKTKPRIHPFQKCCRKAREPFKKPFLIAYHFLCITLKKIFPLAFSIQRLQKTFCRNRWICGFDLFDVMNGLIICGRKKMVDSNSENSWKHVMSLTKAAKLS